MTLLQQWQRLNQWRRNAGLQPYSYGFLADIAKDSAAIPGEPVDLSKATIYAVMRGTYTAATADAIRARLAQCIRVKTGDMVVTHPQAEPAAEPKPRKPRRTRTTPAVHTRRCSHQGYLTIYGNTYYLGAAFAGQVCTVAFLRDKSRGIRVATTDHSRSAYPVDPATNQLGYEVR